VAPPAHGIPLWPGARFTVQDRDRAVARAMRVLYYGMARDPKYFEESGSDLLSAFHNIHFTSLDPRLSRMAWEMGSERALEWRRLHPTLPRDASADTVGDLVFGLDAAERLGVPNPRLRAQLAAAAPRFSAADYLLWDPARESPPRDIPAACPKCERQNARGATTCAYCGHALTMRSTYDLATDALIDAYTGDVARIRLGVPYRDVLRWLPGLRPYPDWSPKRQAEYYAATYCITHVVYTYNFYSTYRVRSDCFPTEFAHLKANLRHAIDDRDPEVMGEFLDTLRAFGMTFDDEVIRGGFEFLLSTQNSDGSWGDPAGMDAYTRYHTTWTAIDGLRDYRWKEILPCPSNAGL
jgi:hypothetical protein